MADLKELMRSRGLSPLDVSRLTGVTTRAVYMWLDGSRKVPNYVWLILKVAA